MANIAIRADGSPSIGMGHVVRMLSLADMLRKEGHHVVFISREPNGIQRILEESFPVFTLPRVKNKVNEDTNTQTDGFHYGDHAMLAREAQRIIDYVTKEEINTIIIDSYNVNEEFFLTIKPHVDKFVCIDDINKFPYPVDVIINGNIGAEKMEYKKYYPHTKLLLGLEYNLIREEFRDLPERIINEKVEHIMITTGGSDPFHLSEKILACCLENEKLKEITYHVIVGQGFQDTVVLEEIARQHTNVILHKNVKRMSEIMLKVDIAISAGGSTLYELCACGTPTIAFVMAENQRMIVEEMGEMKMIYSITHTLVMSDITKYILTHLKKLLYDYSERKIMSNLQIRTFVSSIGQVNSWLNTI